MKNKDGSITLILGAGREADDAVTLLTTLDWLLAEARWHAGWHCAPDCDLPWESETIERGGHGRFPWNKVQTGDPTP